LTSLGSSEFLETTRQRLRKAKLTPKKDLVPTEEETLVQEKTRRRLDQSMALIPRPASAMDNNKRVRASWAGSANEQHSVEFASSRLSNMQDARGSLPPRSWMGGGVMAQLNYGAMARESLLSYKRNQSTSRMKDSLDMTAGEDHSGRPVETSFDLGSVDMSIVRERGPGDAFEGEARREMREKESRLSVYKEIRRATMTCERARAREARSQMEEGERERSVAIAQMRHQEEEAQRDAAARREEAARVEALQQAMAAQLALNREMEALANEPRRQQVEEMRFLDALRCCKIDQCAAERLATVSLCPCVPARTVEDSRVWLCANNCPLKCNPRAYHRLVRDIQAAHK